MKRRLFFSLALTPFVSNDRLVKVGPPQRKHPHLRGQHTIGCILDEYAFFDVSWTDKGTFHPIHQS